MNATTPTNPDKVQQLVELEQEIDQFDMSPLYAYRKEHGYKPVIGEGDPDARIMFIGEAPGEQEAKTGRPFVGNAGRVLERLLKTVGLNRQHVYITNVVKDRPPENRNPRTAEIALYAPFLLRQIEIIQPAVIVTLGRFAKEFVLSQFNLPEQREDISKLHGIPIQAESSYGPVVIVPLYHPAAAFYNLELEQAMERDVQVLQQFV